MMGRDPSVGRAGITVVVGWLLLFASWAPASLVGAEAKVEDRSAQVDQRFDAMGRVVYGATGPSEMDRPDQDLLPASTEELLREIRALPRTWKASRDTPYADLIREAARRTGVDAGLIEAVMSTESAFNPFAVSHAGAVGLMQLMPATARRYGVEDRFDPRQNVLAGARYLSFLIGLFDGDLDRVLAGYNAGENAVLRHGGIPPYRETRNYVRKVRRYLARLEHRALSEASRPDDSPPPAPKVPVRTAPSPRHLLKASPTATTIYHYVDDRGTVHFTNVKPEQAGGKVHVWRPGS